jgi:hypothetical protein
MFHGRIHRRPNTQARNPIPEIVHNYVQWRNDTRYMILTRQNDSENETNEWFKELDENQSDLVETYLNATREPGGRGE